MSSGDTLEWSMATASSLSPALDIYGTFTASTNCTIRTDSTTKVTYCFIEKCRENPTACPWG